MVDRDSRSRTQVLLKKIALGRATNIESENEFYELFPRSKDPVVFALFRTVREMSGDKEHSLASAFSRGSEMRKRLCRWILFLRSDFEYEWPQDRLAPGLRDIYRPSWLDKLLGRQFRLLRSNEMYCRQGDYHVWPFKRVADFESAKSACRIRRPVSLQTV